MSGIRPLREFDRYGAHLAVDPIEMRRKINEIILVLSSTRLRVAALSEPPMAVPVPAAIPPMAIPVPDLNIGGKRTRRKTRRKRRRRRGRTRNKRGGEIYYNPMASQRTKDAARGRLKKKTKRKKVKRKKHTAKKANHPSSTGVVWGGPKAQYYDYPRPGL